MNKVVNSHEAVDLGLPSGTLWATCNVGATAPEEVGGYFVYEENITDSDEEYRRKCDYHIYSPVLDLADDVAYQQWGGAWRTPLLDDFEELINLCQWFWTKERGVSGYLIVGLNGNSIFLPAAGCCYEEEITEGCKVYEMKYDGVGESGCYLCASRYASSKIATHVLNFEQYKRNIAVGFVFVYSTVRAVCRK